ncbi:MAG: O-antigen ligase family protein [Schleiferiaceae bacterium]|nr:O-antigen ligase family protein [Schleiferiaceae bacterium]
MINLHFCKLYRKKFLSINLILLITSLLLTQSRMAFFATCLISILYLFLTRKFSTGRLFIMVIASVVFYFFSNLIAEYLQRGNSLDIASLSFRDQIWLDIIQLLMQDLSQTFIGYGVSNNSILSNLYISVSSAHSGYLQNIVETGIVGLILALLINIKVMVGFWKAASTNSSYLVLFLITLSFSITNITDSITVGVFNSSMLIYQFCIVTAARLKIEV